jgi:RimJ/RimL family protein N-acetyltransferase
VHGSVAGMLRTDRTTWARHKSLEVRTLLIDPRRRGEGIGVAALQALQEREAARGTHRIQAEAYGFNTAGRRTFAAAGFAEEGTRRGAWWRHDEWQDGVLLGWLA